MPFDNATVPLGLVYMAEPIVEDLSGITPLEVFMVTFSSPYYFTNSGRRKLQKLEEDILKLVSIRHPKLLTVYGVKLSIPPANSGKPAMLMVLSEQKPALSLHDVLLECESLREDRALVRVFFFSLFHSLISSTGLYTSDPHSPQCFAYQWPSS